MSFRLRQALQGSVGNQAASSAHKTLLLNGTSQFLNCGTDASLRVTTACTFAAWIYTTKTGDQRVIGKFKTAGNKRSYLLALTSTNLLQLWLSINGQDGDGNRFFVNSSVAVSESTWTHIMGIYDGTDLKVYIDNVEKGSLNEASLSINSDTETVGIGASSSANTPFQGSITTPYVNNTALDSGERAELYEGGKALQFSDLTGDKASLKTGCVLFLPCNDGVTAGQEFVDQSGSGNDGTQVDSETVTGEEKEFFQ